MTTLPPLPASAASDRTGMGSASPSPATPPSAFSGGLSSMMQAMQQIESGYQLLARQVPSLASICAQHVTALRTALPTALAQSAGVQPGASAGPGMADPMAMQSLPGPPQGM